MNFNLPSRFAFALVLAMTIGLSATAQTQAQTKRAPSGISGVSQFRSLGKNDGFVREYMDDYWFGNLANSTGGTIFVGDDMARRLSMGILDFDTSILPDSATITAATLQVRVANLNLHSGNPYFILGDMYADITSPYYGNSVQMESVDFEWFGFGMAGVFSQAYKNNQWISLEVDLFALPAIDPTAHTQFKLYFFDDNDDSIAQGLTITSGNSPYTTYRPLLVVYYDLP